MKTGLAIGLLVISLLAVAACSPNTSPGVACPDGSKARTIAECAPPTAQQPSPTQPQAPPQQQVVQQMLPELQQLISKHNTMVQSMSFLYAPVQLLKSGPTVSPGSTYYVRGTKVRVDVWHQPSAPLFVTTNVDTVYLDTATQTAQGFCMSSLPTKCDVKGAGRQVQYGDYVIKLPLDWLSDIPADATMNNGITFQNIDTDRVRYAKDGKFYELLINSQNGIPLSAKAYSDSDYSNLVGGVEYQNIIFNNLKDADVTPPG